MLANTHSKIYVHVHTQVKACFLNSHTLLPPPQLSAVTMKLNRLSETRSPSQTLSVCTVRKAQGIIFLSINSAAMNIHHKYRLMEINQGRLTVSEAGGGFHRPGGPMSETSKTTVKPKSDVYVCMPVGIWWGLMGTLQAKGGRLSPVHTWVYLVPDDLEWNDPFNKE